MSASAPPTFRIPLILLAVADLALLGKRLWPWPDVLMLPLNGATGIDPAVALLAYIGLIYWMGGSHTAAMRKGLSSGAVLGILAGLPLIGQVMYLARPSVAAAANASDVSYVLLIAAAAIWCVAGFRAAKDSGDATNGMLTALWCAMTSALLACGAVFLNMYLSAPVPETTDPWKLYEGLAIGNPATQALVQSLNGGLAFLLLCPLAGGALGLVFGLFGQGGKD